MSKYRMKPVALVVAAALGTSAGVTQADTLDSVYKVQERKAVAAQASQSRIDKLADQTSSKLQSYKAELKLIEDLKVYNRKLEIQIENQIARLEQIEKSIREVTVIQRQVLPLAERMLDSLDQFVNLDMPFHQEERRQRITQIRNNIDRDDLTPAEKFRQVLEAYKIENEYGRKIDTYADTIEINGVERDVDILRVGRIAMLYQTTDTEITGAWDKATATWVELDPGEYRGAVRQGLRMARKQASIDIMNLPIAAPEAAEQ